LHRKHGVSPAMGCGLSILQIPIFMFVISPAMRHYEAKMELTGASFLWISHLARPDILLLVLYGITMFVSFRISSLPPTDESQRQQQRMMMFMMPMFPFFLLRYPSAFTLYWMLFNITSTILQYRMMKGYDPDKRVIKSILGTPAPMSLSDGKSQSKSENSIPPRPKDGVKSNARKARLSLPETPLDGASDEDENEALNGTLNGKSAPANAEKIETKSTIKAANQNSGQNGSARPESSAKLARETGGANNSGAASGSSNSSKNARRKRRH
jgi:hypothetical protein